MIDAAKSAGVTRIIYTSILKGPANPMILAQDHIAAEAALHAAGTPATILRIKWYTETFTGALGAAAPHGAMIGAAGEGRVSSAARKDYAKAIAATAFDVAHAGKTCELAGDIATPAPTSPPQWPGLRASRWPTCRCGRRIMPRP